LNSAMKKPCRAVKAGSGGNGSRMTAALDASYIGSAPTAGTRDERRSPKLSPTMPVSKEPAGSTLEVVPSFERLHATDHGLHIDQGMIAVGTPQRGRGNLRVPRHGCRSHQAWSATLAGCGGILTHAGDWSNRPATLPSRNLVHLAVALSLFERRGVLQCNSHDKVVAACAIPVSVVFTRAEEQRVSGFAVY
jgi:hypothetical protein